MRTLKEQISHIQTHNPHKMHKIINRIVEDYGDEIEDYFYCHINNKELYDKAVSYFVDFNKRRGAHWMCDVIKMKANINFDEKEYTLYDYAYMANKLYSHAGDLMPEENILKLAKRKLEDEDYPGDPSEQSFHDAMEMLEYFEEG